MNFIALLLLGILSARANGNTKSPLFLSECTVLNQTLDVVRVLTGNRCVPLADGSWVANTSQGIIKYSPSGEKVWLFPGAFHHQVEVDQNGNVFTLGRDVVNIQGARISAETVIKISASGKLLNKFSVAEAFLELEKITASRPGGIRPQLYWTVQAHQRMHPQYQTFDTELTHFNAVYEIPDAQKAQTRGGRYLVTDALMAACLALDGNLKLTGWAFFPPSDIDSKTLPMIHDCQILADGAIIYFQNATDSLPTSTYQIVHWKDGRKIFSFPQSDIDRIHATARGSVQIRPNGYLLSAVSEVGKGVIGVVSPEGKWLLKKDFSTLIQEIKVLPFENFLEKNQLR